MDTPQAIVLGFVQGITEFRPVSSTAHLRNGPGAGATIIATLVSFVVGYASIAGLLKFLTTHSTRVFVLYRVVVGVLVLVLATTGTIS